MYLQDGECYFMYLILSIYEKQRRLNVSNTVTSVVFSLKILFYNTGPAVKSSRPLGYSVESVRNSSLLPYRF